MKHIVLPAALCAALVLILSFGGCTTGKNAVKQEGTYIADTFELSVPEGWMRNDSQERTVFLTKDYPTTASYIAVGATDETQLKELEDYKDNIISNIKSQLTKQLGDSASPEVTVYEKTTVNGYDCMHIVTDYSSSDKKFKQDQYTFDTSKGSVTVTYVTAEDEDFAAEFSASLSSLVIK